MSTQQNPEMPQIEGGDPAIEEKVQDKEGTSSAPAWSLRGLLNGLKRQITCGTIVAITIGLVGLFADLDQLGFTTWRFETTGPTPSPSAPIAPAISSKVFTPGSVKATPAPNSNAAARNTGTPPGVRTLLFTVVAPVPVTSPTPRPPIPGGMGGLDVLNYCGSEMNYTIEGTLYKVPPNGEQIVFLAPGRHIYSANIPGFRGTTGDLEILLGEFLEQSWEAD